MKSLIVLITLLSTNAFAGYVTGDKIHFQSESTYVSAVFSKSLCTNGTEFEATIRKCMEWENDSDDRRCVRHEMIQATQPRVSTRQRCVDFDGDRDCTQWETVPYVQSRVRTVKFFNNNDDLLKIETVTIPDCL